MSRDWGPWTVIKLDALQGYLSAFTSASQRARGTLYLDLFGGRPTNRARGRADLDQDEMFAGSALRAAQVVPPFTKLIVTELSRSAAQEQQEALGQVAGHRAEVIQGDCNIVMPEALDRLVRTDPGWRFAPTFALIDQYSAQVRWETLKALADFKDPSRTKVELCMYFGPSFMIRGLHGPEGTVNARYARQLDIMFGCPLWRHIMAALDDGAITGAQAEAELVNLMRWLLEDRLGYGTTLPLQLKNTRGRDIFSLIFATDHDVGDKIMRSLFGGAEDAVTEMVALHKLERRRHGDADAWLLDPADLAATQRGVRERSPLGSPREPFVYGRLWDRDQ